MKVGDLVRFKRTRWAPPFQGADDVGLVIKTPTQPQFIGQYVRVLWNGATKPEVCYSEELEVIK